MRNLFELDLKAFEPIETAYVDRRLKDRDGELYAKRKSLSEQVRGFIKITSLPPWLLLVASFLILAGLIMIAAYLELITAEDVEEGIVQKILWLVLVGVGLFAVGGIIYIVQILRTRKAKDLPAFRYYEEQAKKLQSEIFSVLGIPENAEKVDALYVARKVNKPSPKESRFSTTYYPFDVYLFREGEAFCIGNEGFVNKIPLSHIVSIEQQKGGITLGSWNKEEKPNKGRYKQYKIRNTNGYGRDGYLVKPYYKLSIMSGAEENHIIIPCYDLDSYLKVTGKTVS